jgi:hypothetical protein
MNCPRCSEKCGSAPMCEGCAHDLRERTNLRHFDGHQPLEEAEAAARKELFGEEQEELFDASEIARRVDKV